MSKLLAFALLALSLIGCVPSDSPAFQPNPFDSPRALATPICQRAVLNRWPSAKFVDADDWTIVKRASGNYQILMQFEVLIGRLSNGTEVTAPALRVCTLQMVNGSMQLVSVGKGDAS